MSQLNPEQRKLLRRRESHLKEFVADAFPCIEELLARIGADDQYMVPIDLERVMAVVDTWFSDFEFAELDSKDFVWVQTRLMYLIGEVFVTRYGGRWEVQWDTEADFFGQYVIGVFQNVMPITTLISPVYVAFHYMQEPSGRSLLSLIERIRERAISEGVQFNFKVMRNL